MKLRKLIGEYTGWMYAIHEACAKGIIGFVERDEKMEQVRRWARELIGYDLLEREL